MARDTTTIMSPQQAHKALALPEIWTSIASHLPQPDLANLVQVSRLCYTAARPILYNTPLLIFNKDNKVPIDAFCASSGLKYPRHLVVAPLFPAHNIRREEEEARGLVHKMVHDICASIPRDTLLSFAVGYPLPPPTLSLLHTRQTKARPPSTSPPVAFLIFGHVKLEQVEVTALELSKRSFENKYRTIADIVRNG